MRFLNKNILVVCFQRLINDSRVGHLVVTVGSRNYYMPYQVMIRSFNPKGQSPPSGVETIMSAEERK